MGSLDLDFFIDLLILVSPIILGIIINRIRKKKKDDPQVSKYLNNIELFFASLIIISFFLPWIKQSFFSLSGYQFWDGASGETSIDTQENFLLLLVPITCICTIAANMLKYNSKLIARLSGIYITVYLVYFGVKIAGDANISIGFGLTYASGLLMFITSKETKQSILTKENNS